MGKSASELREQKALLRKLLAEGATEYECMEELGFTKVSALRSLRQNVFSDELEELHEETAAKSYIRYKIRIEQLCRELDDVIEMGKEKHSALSAVVGAVKAKARLIENMLERGQELGVLPIATVEEEKSGKSNEELRERLDELKGEFETLIKETAGSDYVDEPEDELYFIKGEGEEEEEVEPEEVPA